MTNPTPLHTEIEGIADNIWKIGVSEEAYTMQELDEAIKNNRKDS